jgi:hypothetical protein
VDPAGGFPSPSPGLLALRCSITIWRGLLASCIPSGRNPPAFAGWYRSPIRTELADILAGGDAGLAEVHRGIKADPAAADNRHLLADRRFIAQDIEVAQHLRMIDPAISGIAGDPVARIISSNARRSSAVTRVSSRSATR